MEQMHNLLEGLVQSCTWTDDQGCPSSLMNVTVPTCEMKGGCLWKSPLRLQQQLLLQGGICPFLSPSLLEENEEGTRTFLGK